MFHWAQRDWKCLRPLCVPVFSFSIILQACSYWSVSCASLQPDGWLTAGNELWRNVRKQLCWEKIYWWKISEWERGKLKQGIRRQSPRLLYFLVEKWQLLTTNHRPVWQVIILAASRPPCCLPANSISAPLSGGHLCSASPDKWEKCGAAAQWCEGPAWSLDPSPIGLCT